MCQYLKTITDWDNIDHLDCGHPEKDGICEECEFGDKKVIPEIIETKKGFYYISKTRKIKSNPLWVGPFKTEEEAFGNYYQVEA